MRRIGRQISGAPTTGARQGALSIPFMSTEAKRPNPFVSLLLLIVAVAVGAHLSGIPLLLTKAFVAVVLVAIYGYFAVRVVTPLGIESTRTRGVIGLVLGVATLCLTWAVRIPAFSGWETAFTASPQAVYDAVVERAGSMEVSKGFGAGTSTEGPSWLMLGTYILEGLAFVGVMTLGALLSGPDKPKATDAEDADGADSDGSTREAA